MNAWNGFSHAISTTKDSILYSDSVVPSKFGKSERRFRWLFSDVFGHHIQIDTTNRSGEVADVVQGNRKRIIEQDEITAIFREKFLDGFKVSDTPNENQQDLEENLLDDWKEIAEICEPAIVFPYIKTKGFGNNRLSLLMGNAGQGKSLLLSKILTNCELTQIDVKNGRPIIIYINMESAWTKEDGAFKPIDSNFWELIFNRLKEKCLKGESNEQLRNILKKIATEDLLSSEDKLRDICRVLPDHGYYAVIAIDNVDRYHFSEVRHSFFEEYKSEQINSIQKNISKVVAKFSDYDALGRISASIIIICRRPVYDHLMAAADGSDPNDNRLKGYSVYQLLEATTRQIIYPRLQTLKHLIDSLLKTNSLTHDDVQSLQVAVSILEHSTIDRQSGSEARDGLRGDVCDLLLDLSHQGARGVVQFLSEFEFDCRKNGEAIERVFKNQPRNLLRLYIANRRKRYSQSAQHFPNIFLNDCCADPDPKFPLAYTSHRQTYWLKWNVLKLIESSPGGVIEFGELHTILCKTASYEDHLFRLVVGSLATPNKSSCIAIKYKNHSINSRVLSLTNRGKALVGDQHSKVLMGVPFCFSFDYLQLIADDPLMSFPNELADLIVPEEISLDYALREKDEYHRRGLEYLRKKMPASLQFLRLLQSSWVREELLIKKINPEIIQKIAPPFAIISEVLLNAFEAILVNWDADGKKLSKDLRSDWEAMQADKSYDLIWSNFQ